MSRVIILENTCKNAIQIMKESGPNHLERLKLLSIPAELMLIVAISLCAGQFTIKDLMKLLGVGRKEAGQTWHQAREDARASGEVPDRPATSAGRRATNEPDFNDPY
jgi:hypothetical protein